MSGLDDFLKLAAQAGVTHMTPELVQQIAQRSTELEAGAQLIAHEPCTYRCEAWPDCACAQARCPWDEFKPSKDLA